MPRFSFSGTLLLLVCVLSAMMGFLGGIGGAVLSARLFDPFSVSDSGVNDLLKLTKENVDPAIIGLIEEESATIDVVKRVAPAVVNVLVRKPQKVLIQGSSAASSPEGQMENLVEIGGGTGFFVSSDGLIVTNRHVVFDEAAVYAIMTSDSREFSATVVARDPVLDIAFLRIDGQGFPTVKFGDRENIHIGQTVIAIGNTLSQFQNTVTKGVVSGLDRHIQAGLFGGDSELIDEAIQTDATINPGNSGGPLINLLGEVIGMNTAISVEGERIGFAIPADEVERAAHDVQTLGRIVRPQLGVRYVMITPTFAKNNGLSADHGAWLVAGEGAESSAILSGSPAENAGLQTGDVLIALNGNPLTVTEPLAQQIRDFYPGDEVRFTLMRGKNTLEVIVVLAEFQPEHR